MLDALIVSLCMLATGFQGQGTNSGDSPRPPLASELESKIDPRGQPWKHAGWQPHGVVLLNGHEAHQTRPARLNFIGGEWPYNNSQMPYLVYMPERRRLLLAASVDKPTIKAIFVVSDDFGQSWSQPRWLHTNAAGEPDIGAATQLTYLAGGKLLLGNETRYWASVDYGETWNDYAPVPKGQGGKPLYQWDPLLVDRDPHSGKVLRLVETRYQPNGEFDRPGYFSQGCIRVSQNEGLTWNAELAVPQWKGVNEIVVCRAANRDLVAACRTDNHPRFLGRDDDQYSGLATSISTDEGRTWSALNPIYQWGRHHPHIVLLPDGRLVTTYVVRHGYTDTKQGQHRFGVEAVISQDHGKTWDLDHKFILASNASVMTGDRANWGSPQSTSNVLLPTGELLTVFGTGVRNQPSQTLWLMDVAMVKWTPGNQPLNNTDTLRKSPIESDLRNVFDLDSIK